MKIGNIIDTIIYFAVAVSAFTIGACCSSDVWKKECVQRGYAEYCPTNGVWQWKEPVKQEPTTMLCITNYVELPWHKPGQGFTNYEYQLNPMPSITKP